MTIIASQQEMCTSAQCRWTQSMYVHRTEMPINIHLKYYFNSLLHVNKIEAVFIRGEGKLFPISLFTQYGWLWRKGQWPWY